MVVDRFAEEDHCAVVDHDAPVVPNVAPHISATRSAMVLNVAPRGVAQIETRAVQNVAPSVAQLVAQLDARVAVGVAVEFVFPALDCFAVGSR